MVKTIGSFLGSYLNFRVENASDGKGQSRFGKCSLGRNCFCFGGTHSSVVLHENVLSAGRGTSVDAR